MINPGPITLAPSPPQKQNPITLPSPPSFLKKKQVFSLAHGSVFDELNMKSRANRHRSSESTVLKITEEGALFRSYRDGRKVLLTPESSVRAQKGGWVGGGCALILTAALWGVFFLKYRVLLEATTQNATPQQS